MESFDLTPAAATNRGGDILDTIMDQCAAPHFQYQSFSLPPSTLASFERSIDIEMADPHMPFATSSVRGVDTPTPSQLEADRLSAMQQREITIQHDKDVAEWKAYETNFPHPYLYPIARHPGQYVWLPSQGKIASTSQDVSVPLERIQEVYPNAHRVYDAHWEPVTSLLEFIEYFDDALEPVPFNPWKGKGRSELQPTECPEFYSQVMEDWREGPIKGSKAFLAFAIAALSVLMEKNHPAHKLFWDICLIRDGPLRVYERTVYIVKEILAEYPSRICPHSLNAEREEFQELYCTPGGKRKFVPSHDDDVWIPRPQKRLRPEPAATTQQEVATTPKSKSKSKPKSKSNSRSPATASATIIPKSPPAPKIARPRAPRAKPSPTIVPPEGLRRSTRNATQTEKALLAEKVEAEVAVAVAVAVEAPVEVVPVVAPPVAPIVQSAAKEILSAKTKPKSQPKRKAPVSKKAKQEILDEAIIADQAPAPTPKPQPHTPAKGSSLRLKTTPGRCRSGSSGSETVTTSPISEEGRHLSTQSNETLVSLPSPPESGKRKREEAEEGEEEVVSPVVEEASTPARVTRGRGRAAKAPATPAVVPAATQPRNKRRKTTKA